MNIKVTHFANPFSFFCLPQDSNCVNSPVTQVETNDVVHNKMEVSDLNHGQYVAVKWGNKWVRGVITTEKLFLIWLIDYGIYVSPDDKIVYLQLPPEHKNYPSKVFEASIHGVMPLDLMLTMDEKMKHEKCVNWVPAAIEKAKTLIASASKIIFFPVALLSTKYNDIVIGDLFIEYYKNKVINIKDELMTFPTYLYDNKEDYITSLSSFYTTRRHHRACLLKPVTPCDLPTISVKTTFAEYNAICTNAMQFEPLPVSHTDDATIQIKSKRNSNREYKLSTEEIEMYASMYVSIAGREYNVLNVILNKIKDFNMCKRYQDHDLKGLGRGHSRHSESLFTS